MTDTVQAHILELATLQTRQHGPGALWVQEGAEPVYRTLEQLHPPQFRTAFTQTWEATAGNDSFIVVADPQQLHVVKVPATPEQDAPPTIIHET
jgi:hypothetical protein